MRGHEDMWSRGRAVVAHCSQPELRRGRDAAAARRCGIGDAAARKGAESGGAERGRRLLPALRTFRSAARRSIDMRRRRLKKMAQFLKKGAWLSRTLRDSPAASRRCAAPGTRGPAGSRCDSASPAISKRESRAPNGFSAPNLLHVLHEVRIFAHESRELLLLEPGFPYP